MAWRDRDTSRGDRFSEELLENENDRLMEGVAAKVASLKHVAIDLRSEAKDQVNLVSDSDGLFDQVGSLLSNSFKRVQGMRRTRTQNCKIMCYFAVLASVFFFVAYFLLGIVMSR